MRNKLIVPAAIVGLLAASGVAYADTEEDTVREPDTTFSFGYDEENGVFVWGASDRDGVFDCGLGNGELQATYTRVPDGHLLVDDLQDEECAVSGDFVAGPQGQINHGMFFRLFNLMHDGPGRGCLVRHIAQSDLGNGDQQVNVPDVDTEAEEPGDTLEGALEFETVMTKCNHGSQTLATTEDGNGPPAHVGRPDHAGPPDDARGNSASAPGRNP